MKEIVFSESAKGGLKFAQRYDEREMRRGAMSWIGRKPSQEELDRMWAGKAVGGDPADVLGVALGLDIGDVSAARSSQDLERAKIAAGQGEKLRIWTSGMPGDACGLRHLLWEIRGCDCEVSVIELPGYWQDGDCVIRYSGWGDVLHGKFYQFLSLERKLSLGERRALAAEWADAVAENAPLRAVVNGKLMGVGADFYDFALEKCMPEGPFHMGRLIADVLGKYPLGVGDEWYARRIEGMIGRGELRVVDPGGDHPYSRTLERV